MQRAGFNGPRATRESNALPMLIAHPNR